MLPQQKYKLCAVPVSNEHPNAMKATSDLLRPQRLWLKNCCSILNQKPDKTLSRELLGSRHRVLLRVFAQTSGQYYCALGTASCYARSRKNRANAKLTVLKSLGVYLASSCLSRMRKRHWSARKACTRAVTSPLPSFRSTSISAPKAAVFHCSTALVCTGF